MNSLTVSTLNSLSANLTNHLIQSNLSEINFTTTKSASIIQNETKTLSDSIPNIILPKKGSAEEEHSFSMAIFFVLSVIAACIIVIHLILQLKINYIPESLAVVLTGALIGLIIKLSSSKMSEGWQREEMFNPTTFFLVILPPIIFDEAYNLHKGNFFQNIGSILVFAIFGTTISALVIGFGIWLLGLVRIEYYFNLFCN